MESDNIAIMGKSTFTQAYSTASSTSDSSFSASGKLENSSAKIPRKLSWLKDVIISKRSGRSHSWSSDSSKDAQSKHDDSPRELKSPDISPRCSVSEFLFGGKCATCAIPSTTEEEDQLIIRLESFLQEDDVFVMDLVTNLLGNHVHQGHLMVRFLVAVLDSELTSNSKARSFKRQKIISTFVKSGSKYRIDILPESASTFAHLLCFKRMVLIHLIREECVKTALSSAIKESAA